MWRDRRPVPVEADRSIGVDSYQLRADHWSESEECLRIGRLSSSDCTQCSSDEYPAALCQHYRAKAGILKHVLLRCPRRWRDDASNARAPPFTKVHNCINQPCNGLWEKIARVYTFRKCANLKSRFMKRAYTHSKLLSPVLRSPDQSIKN